MLTSSDWDAFLERQPDAHLLQTSQWGALKAAFGWEVARIATDQAGAQILFRRLPFGVTMAYIPKGPIGEHWDELWPRVDELCRRKHAVFLKIEPDLWEDKNGGQSGVPPPTFVETPHVIQPRRTLIVELNGDEEQILARMKQKTRYNTRLALRKGVVVRSSADLEAFASLIDETGDRDNFAVHNIDYYRRAYELFQPRGGCELLIAEFEHEPLAALMVFARGTRAWYLYGASSNAHRALMPSYLLQWEAIRWARARGCMEYDLWGVPDADEETIEANFTTRSDGLWGVYRFKRGFGGQLHRTAGSWDRVYNRVLYKLYRWWVMRGK